MQLILPIYLLIVNLAPLLIISEIQIIKSNYLEHISWLLTNGVFQINSYYYKNYILLIIPCSSHAVTADVSLADTASAASFFLTDAVVLTGSATGREPGTRQLTGTVANGRFRHSWQLIVTSDRCSGQAGCSNSWQVLSKLTGAVIDGSWQCNHS